MGVHKQPIKCLNKPLITYKFPRSKIRISKLVQQFGRNLNTHIPELSISEWRVPTYFSFSPSKLLIVPFNASIISGWVRNRIVLFRISETEISMAKYLWTLHEFRLSISNESKVSEQMGDVIKIVSRVSVLTQGRSNYSNYNDWVRNITLACLQSDSQSLLLHSRRMNPPPPGFNF